MRDDGLGGAAGDGNGLSGMRERVELLGGSLSITSERGQGTQLRIALPWRERDPEDPGATRPRLRATCVRSAESDWRAAATVLPSRHCVDRSCF